MLRSRARPPGTEARLRIRALPSFILANVLRAASAVHYRSIDRLRADRWLALVDLLGAALGTVPDPDLGGLGVSAHRARSAPSRCGPRRFERRGSSVSF